MPNRKITQLSPNTNPTISDVFPIVNNGVTKKLSLDGLVSFLTPYLEENALTGGTYNSVSGILTLNNNTGGTINISGFYTGATDVFVTGGTYSNGTTIFKNNTGGTFSVTGITTQDVFVTGGTYSASAETATFKNNTGGTFSVTGITNGNTKKWIESQIIQIAGNESVLVSGNYVLIDTQLNILNSNNNITIGNISFDKEGELYIGGNVYFQDTTINNDGIISIAGALILSGNTTITGTGIII